MSYATVLLCSTLAISISAELIGPLQARQDSYATSQATHVSNLNELPCDLILPTFEFLPPEPSKRVRMTTSGWESTQVYHALYLPKDWVRGKKYPVLVEYAGNGGYNNSLGDVCSGKVEDTKLGFGLSGGIGYLWIGMPCVERVDGSLRNATKWWGNIEETKRYCLATLQTTIDTFGGDADRTILCGFSRGAIGCNVIGLQDDEIASHWRGFFCHSHYDGVREQVWYPLGNRELVNQRLARLNHRPQWISHEVTVEPIRDYLKREYRSGQFTFESLPYANHTDAWVMRDLAIRTKAREWLKKVIESESDK